MPFLLFFVYNFQTPEISEQVNAFTEMALSVNNKYLALYADTGLVWIGSSNLKVSFSHQLVTFPTNFIFKIPWRVLFVSKWILFFIYCRLFTVNLTLDRHRVLSNWHGKHLPCSIYTVSMIVLNLYSACVLFCIPLPLLFYLIYSYIGVEMVLWYVIGHINMWW